MLLEGLGGVDGRQERGLPHRYAMSTVDVSLTHDGHAAPERQAGNAAHEHRRAHFIVAALHVDMPLGGMGSGGGSRTLSLSPCPGHITLMPFLASCERHDIHAVM